MGDYDEVIVRKAKAKAEAYAEKEICQTNLAVARTWIENWLRLRLRKLFMPRSSLIKNISPNRIRPPHERR